MTHCYAERVEYSERKRPAEKKKKKRSRNIIWFNPPFSLNVHVFTDVARCFLKAVDRHLPKRSPSYKIVNRNNIKVSYSTMSSMQSIIRGHNNRNSKEDINDQQLAEANSIAWSTARSARAYSSSIKTCDGCLTEKLIIARSDKARCLNKRSELVSKFRHENQYYLSNCFN